MEQLSNWFAMGGYAWYVWLSYAIGLLVLVLNIWLPLRVHRRLLEHSGRGGKYDSGAGRVA